ncbi:helix-turn-helix transcriptional regulator [Vibrio hepatarius]|uniref:helix-turn-helix transcriptional regulator n=1 Tax=Vibrio hepatarius TaxID=171383 RepID=UPI001C0A2CF2|nr:YafY family protein [Vibrio hepatarius]MBU2896195.1 YafY family transcriptional regulator [Vibrio hepatarius]
MTKSERLLELLTLLRSKRYAVTASELANTLNVSERTIYRDIKSLIKTGVPVSGESGVGYMLQSGSHLPPLMFTKDEMMALELGIRMVRSLSDSELAKSALTASSKIQSVLSDKLKQQVENFPICVPNVHTTRLSSNFGKILRHSIDDRLKIKLHYIDKNLNKSERTVQPLGLVFWCHSWTLVSWCDLREEYRQFRLDRIENCVVLDDKYETAENRSLEHYIRLCAPSL